MESVSGDDPVSVSRARMSLPLQAKEFGVALLGQGG